MPSIRTIITLVLLGIIILYIVPASTVQNIPMADSLGLLDLQVTIKSNITQLIHSVREVIQIFIGNFITDMLNSAQQSAQEGLLPSQ